MMTNIIKYGATFLAGSVVGGVVVSVIIDRRIKMLQKAFGEAASSMINDIESEYSAVEE